MSWQTLIRTIGCCGLSCLTYGQAASADTIFFDTFIDRDAEDGMPVTWAPELGTWDASSGDYVASDPVRFVRISLAPEHDTLGDTSVQAQVRAVGNTGIGLGVRRAPGPFGYGGFIDVDGTLSIVRVDGAPAANTLGSAVVPFNAVDQDVMLQVDAIGSELSLWAWPEGEPSPAAPQLVVSDSTYPTGAVGLISAAGGDPSSSSATFRFVHVANTHIPEPSTFVLAGDYNGNGTVEQADLDLVLLNWGNATPPVPAGWDDDLPSGTIDQEELDKVLLNWGSQATPPAAGSVPEPNGLVLAALLVLMLPATRRFLAECPARPKMAA